MLDRLFLRFVGGAGYCREDAPFLFVGDERKCENLGAILEIKLNKWVPIVLKTQFA